MAVASTGDRLEVTLGTTRIELTVPFVKGEVKPPVGFGPISEPVPAWLWIGPEDAVGARTPTLEPVLDPEP